MLEIIATEDVARERLQKLSVWVSGFGPLTQNPLPPPLLNGPKSQKIEQICIPFQLKIYLADFLKSPSPP